MTKKAIKKIIEFIICFATLYYLFKRFLKCYHGHIEIQTSEAIS